MTQETLKRALDFVESINLGSRSASVEQQREVIAICKEALAHPPQRPWLDLTDGVMCDIAIKHGLMSIDWIDFARAIEAASRSKNT